ncbi:FAD-dependent oxidoreductase [Aestuariispira insulae]
MTTKRMGLSGKPETAAEMAARFDDLHPPYNEMMAMTESNRCLYCYDAPCTTACPTSIDIPAFIRKISTGNPNGAAKTILEENILGGTCARVCPTETLCEQACVCNELEGGPVPIGRLQRYAVDHFMEADKPHPFGRKPSSGKTVAVVGAGPAGLACAHRLAMLGHDAVVFEAKAKAGGLNEYGLAAYKMTNDFAQKEVDFLLEIGGITIQYEQRLGDNLLLADLSRDYDAVFIGIGLGDVNDLGLEGEDKDGIHSAIDFIEEIRQAPDKRDVAVGDNVIVIGGGNTAIDAAVQAKRLGAGEVTLVYRRGAEQMGATDFEQDLAKLNDVIVRYWSMPSGIKGNGKVESMVFEKAELDGGKLMGTGETYEVKADMVLKAVGQKLLPSGLDGIELNRGKLVLDEKFQTTMGGVFAGGDAVASGEDLTVQAVEDGKQAAHAIDQYLSGM